MPQVSRHSDIAATGHRCTPKVPVIATQFTVFANGTPVARMADPTQSHTIRRGDECKGHDAQINIGSGTVFAEGIPMARVGDSTDAGAMIMGAPNVFAGG